MKVKLTGEITLSTEFEVEIDVADFQVWCFEVQVNPDDPWAVARYLADTNSEAEIWATAPNDLNDYDVEYTDFTSAEVISE